MGRNDDGQLGFINQMMDNEGKLIYTYPNPLKIDLPKINQIVSSSNFNYALDTENNKVYSWGIGMNHVLGNKSDNDEKLPFTIPNEFFQNKIIGQIGLGGQHITLGLYETNEKDKLIIPSLENKYLNEYKERLEQERIRIKEEKIKLKEEQNKRMFQELSDEDITTTRRSKRVKNKQVENKELE